MYGDALDGVFKLDPLERRAAVSAAFIKCSACGSMRDLVVLLAEYEADVDCLAPVDASPVLNTTVEVSALMAAAAHSRLAVVKMLVSRHASIDLEDEVCDVEWAWGPLHGCARWLAGGIVPLNRSLGLGCRVPPPLSHHASAHRGAGCGGHTFVCLALSDGTGGQHRAALRRSCR